MLILTGIPELMGYIYEEPQLHRLATHQIFPDLEVLGDLNVINDIVQSVANFGGRSPSGCSVPPDHHSIIR